LIYRPGEAILVDCGNKGSEVKIIQDMTRLGLRPEDLRLLVLTHAHFDHAGAARRLKELTGCRIMVHSKEASRLKAGFTPIPAGTRWKARVLVALGRTFAKGLMKYPPAIPDLLVEESASLAGFGFKGRVIHSPGHTPGSMVLFMERGEMVAGDTLFGVPGKRIFPPFAEDRAELLRSWEMISRMDVKLFYPAHGRSLGRASFLNELEVLGASR
jgi:glyoxylase-like metal-dependent hydrolase (beta-lactamase superfamily II)